MNKLFVIMLVFAMLLMCGSAMALDNPVKIAIGYDLDDRCTQELVGTAIKEDLLEVKGLDYDLMMVSDNGETFYSDNKGVGNALSYNYDISDTVSAFVGLGFNTKRVEKIQRHRLGETNKFAYIGLGGKF